MIAIGAIFTILGFLFAVGWMWTLGIILLVIGVILELAGSFERPVLGRRYWY
jgi:hypothetical protein